MPSMRRGLVVGAGAAAKAGVMASSIGKASSTPVPAKKRRRETARLNATNGAWEERKGAIGVGLLVKEEFAGDKSADQVADAVTARLGPVEDGLDLGAVGKAHRGAGGVDGELTDEVAGQLTFVGGDEARPTLSSEFSIPSSHLVLKVRSPLRLVPTRGGVLRIEEV